MMVLRATVTLLLLLLVVRYSDGGAVAGVSSLGCYQDQVDRVWKNGLNKLAGSTPQLCVRVCTGFQYAGLQSGVHCYCGQTLPPVRLSQTSCNRPCEGDRSTTCGGHWAMEVYPVPLQTDVSEGTHLGCYADNPERVWETGLHRLAANAPQVCRNLCLGHNYFALQGRLWCQCGDHLPPMQYGQSACRAKCPGKMAATCGGNFTMDVYAVQPQAVRPPVRPTPEPPHGSHAGCFEDVKERVWKNGINVIRNNNGPELCKMICRGNKFAGLEAGIQCLCGDVLPPTSLPRTMCNKPCGGDKHNTCGGHLALDVHRVDVAGIQVPDKQPDTHLGCYEDTKERVWKHGLNRLDKNSPQLCRNLCSGFKFYGLEAGSLCLCGDVIPPRKIAQESCGAPCPGSPGMKCGGVSALDVYQGGSADIENNVLTPMGCFEDNKDRVWPHGVNSLVRNTPELCQAVCAGFKYLGLERGVWCMCGDSLPTIRLPQSSCNRPCPGNRNVTCGAGWGMQVYEVTSPRSTPVRINGVEDGVHLGCYEDTKERVWKHGLNRLDKNSPQLCRNLCSGFKFYGLEAGSWCLCGDVIPPRKITQESCNTPCPGSTGKKCGGSWTLDVYLVGGSDPLSACGKRRRKPGPGVVQLTSGGSATELGDSPWHTGIYKVIGAGDALTQICGGSLITPQHVLTAAHCFWDVTAKRARPAREYKAAAGKYHRGWSHADDDDETSLQRRDVTRIAVHASYAGFDKYLAHDIAMLTLAVKMEVTWSVGVVCLDWRHELEDTQLKNNNLGIVTGWELTGELNAPSDVLKTVRLPYVPYDVCTTLVEEKFKLFLTHDKLCAGYINKSISVCGGDSGSGYVFPDMHSVDQHRYRLGSEKDTSSYYLRGIASVGHLPTDYSLAVCNNQQLAGFTSLSPYMTWIEQQVNM